MNRGEEGDVRGVCNLKDAEGNECGREFVSRVAMQEHQRKEEGGQHGGGRRRSDTAPAAAH